MSTLTLVEGQARTGLSASHTIMELVAMLAERKGDEYPRVEMRLTYDEAVKVVKSIRTRKVSLFIRAKQWAPSKDDPERGFEVSANVWSTRGNVLRYLESAYYPRVRDAALIEMGLYSNCLFIGG